MTHGETLSQMIFNVTVDSVMIHWVTVVEGGGGPRGPWAIDTSPRVVCLRQLRTDHVDVDSITTEGFKLPHRAL